MAQSPEEQIVYSVVQVHMENYFPGGTREIISIDTLIYNNEPDIFVVNLKEGGWILISGDKRVIPVLGFNYEGRFAQPDKSGNIACYEWMSSYSEQIKEVREEKGMPVHKGWQTDQAGGKGIEGETVDIDPLIKTEWHQNAGWNRFCPEDSLGPGGHTYVGCVAVALAQALSVYAVPDTGTGFKKYSREDYGIIEVKFYETNYKWDSMSLDTSDDYNALLLFHCAVAVNMNFGPDASSAYTSGTKSAMKDYFKMSRKSVYWVRRSDEEQWIQIIIDNLQKGRPIIYSGNADDGESGHAFNIDGVRESKYFHLNWGWGGSHNGYYLIDNLKPGSNDFSKNQAAIFGIQPYYYPTDVLLNDTIIPIGIPPGSAVAKAEVVDEAYDNEYELILVSDSVYINNEWVSDYYLENDSLRTGRIFTEDDIGEDTIRFYVTDKYDNYIETDVVLTVTETTGFTVTASYDNRIDELSIYPNPASGIININIDNELPVDCLRIYSQAGLMVREIKSPPGQMKIDIHEFTQGLYILEIRYANGFVTRGKVLIL